MKHAVFQIIEILSILLFYALLLIRKDLNRSVFIKVEKKRMISGRVDKLMLSELPVFDTVVVNRQRWFIKYLGRC